jgi:hypothetical protein
MADLTGAQKQSYWRYNARFTTILLIVRRHLSSINSLIKLTTTTWGSKEDRDEH